MGLSRYAKQLTFTLATLICLGLMGCSELLYRQTCVELASDMRYCLAPLEPSALSANSGQQINSEGEIFSSQSLSQKVNIRHGDQSHELLTQLEIEDNKMTLVGLAPLGQALFTLVYDGHTLSSEQSLLLGDSFKAEYLMAMMQLIYWPKYSVSSHLQGGELRLGQCDSLPCRQIYRQGNKAESEVINIRYRQQGDSLWQAQVHLAIPQAKFELDIQPI
ncbi:DUF3261 domain-containing protein [Shewanella sp. A25]|nr:DUF3261 domain-containing protein [Shewanella shenzhenensis]